MNLTERLEWLLIGCVIGFVFGCFVCFLRKLDERSRGATSGRKERVRNEAGFMRHPYVADIAMVIALALTVFAAFSAQQTNNKLENVSNCNKEFLSKQIVASTTRTEFLKTQLDSNVALQKDQSSFLRTILDQNATDKEEIDATRAYLGSLDHFLEVAARSNTLQPYPNVDDLQACLDSS